MYILPNIDMNKVILTLVFALAVFTLSALLVPASILAQTNLEPGVCVSVYGGGVVCGAKHEVVPTALGDINPAVLGMIFLGASASLFVLSKKMKKTSEISG